MFFEQPDWRHRTAIRAAILGVSNSDLARQLDCSRQAVHGLLSRISPTLATLKKLESVLGVSQGWLCQRQSLKETVMDALYFEQPAWMRKNDERS
jgi:ribosome-binding protein aMBF1 (putative translation factor)